MKCWEELFKAPYPSKIRRRKNKKLVRFDPRKCFRKSRRFTNRLPQRVAINLHTLYMQTTNCLSTLQLIKLNPTIYLKIILCRLWQAQANHYRKWQQNRRSILKFNSFTSTISIIGLTCMNPWKSESERSSKTSQMQQRPFASTRKVHYRLHVDKMLT